METSLAQHSIFDDKVLDEAENDASIRDEFNDDSFQEGEDQNANADISQDDIAYL